MRKCLLFTLLCLGVLLPGTARADTWAIYWYICGSDLEARFGSATNDVVEAGNATFSQDVKLVIQTGGTQKWDEITTNSGNIKISPRHIERYLFDDTHSFSKIARLPQANMGKSKTLSDFLSFCLKNYPADHKMLIIWDHGGGSAGTLANDQNFEMEGMTSADVEKALADVLGKNPKTPPLDIIGFDACLMASLDIAVRMSPFARYMVASEETEPTLGWNYTPFLNALQNSSLSPLDLCKAICDAYIEGLKAEQEEGFDPLMDATLSVIDLAKVQNLKLAWNILGFELLAQNADDEEELMYTRIGRAADTSEKFLNSSSDGYSNMMDMGSFIEKISHNSELKDDVLKELQKTVLYNVTGETHKKASGISCYYPFDGGKTYGRMLNSRDRSVFVILQGLKFGLIDGDTAKNQLSELMNEVDQSLNQEGEEPTVASPATGTVAQTVEGCVHYVTRKPRSADGQIRLDHLLTAGLTAISREQNHQFDISALKDFPIRISEKGDAELNVGPEMVRNLESVYFYLALYDQDEDLIVILGKDADLHGDWKNGIFSSHFTNHWAELNGHLVFLDVENTDEKNFYYRIPLKLNGKDVNLYALYDLESQVYRIIGARTVTSEGLVDKNLIRLKAGDKVGTVFLASKLSDSEELTEIEIDTFTLSGEIKIEDTDLGDSNFVYMFEMNDTRGRSETSEVALVSVENGKITISR